MMVQRATFSRAEQVGLPGVGRPMLQVVKGVLAVGDAARVR